MRSDQDFYYTAKSAFRAPELKVKGSRFIGEIFPVATKEEIDSHLSRIRKESYDATHHCYAFRLGFNAVNIRAADDGEPAGTAGKPILLSLSSNDLTNCLLVVTRYYGGTNLGTGGLSRAYGKAAQLVVAGTAIEKVYLTDKLSLILSYEEIASLERLLILYGAKFNVVYGEKIKIEAHIRKSLSKKIKDDIYGKFFGKVLISSG